MRLYLRPPPRFVVWPPMSAVTVVSRPDAIVVTADRGSVAGPALSPSGTALPGEKGSKMGVTAGGCVWALAGHGAAPGADLRELLAELRSPDPRQAAADAAVAFDGAAGAIRAGAWDPPSDMPGLTTPVLAVAVIAGVHDGRPEVFQVGLPAEGRSASVPALWGSVVLAPEEVRPALAAAAEEAERAATREEALGVMRSGIREAAVAQPAYISLHLDEAVFAPGAASAVVTQLFSRPGLPRGV